MTISAVVAVDVPKTLQLADIGIAGLDRDRRVLAFFLRFHVSFQGSLGERLMSATWIEQRHAP